MHTGFREWMVVRLNRDDNLTWPVLVRRLAPSGWIHPALAGRPVHALLFVLLGKRVNEHVTRPETKSEQAEAKSV
ncbi:hypothetical protein ACWFRM_27550 [Streptomyces sp. NPDC055144]